LDGNKENDTLSFVINKIAHKDAAIEYVADHNGGFICSDHGNADIIIRNLGADTLDSISFDLIVNNQPPVEVIWYGSLAYGEETTYSFPVGPLSAGANAISMQATQVNGTDDELPSNNQIAWNFDANPNGQGLILYFTTDNFPSESSWKLFDAANNVIASGNGFTQQQHTYITDFCLDPEACYTFTVYDAFGDGMSSQGVTGDYEIHNGDGEVIAQLAKPNFGSQSSSQFCLTGMCMFALNAGVGPESHPGAGDGMVMGEVENALGHVQYSIDGGLHYQDGSIFDHLLAGQYNLIAHDGAGCYDTVSVTIISCTLQSVIQTVPAIGGDIGEIHINAIGGIGPVTYSLNGGDFTLDTVYTMLEPGNYIVAIRDTAGCQIIDTVTVSTMVSTTTIGQDTYIS
ncbi:MAG TPA: hypothetical protein VJ508_08860, partial [Saprospiraceae bacterium]|nr:hypothetical protein [Saprospiraceae bacterium]